MNIQQQINNLETQLKQIEQRLINVRGFTGVATYDTREPTGIIDRADVSLSFNDANRKLTVAPAVTDFSFYYNGIKHTKISSETITIPNVEGVHLVYYDSTATLQQIANPSKSQIAVAFTTYCTVAYVYWDVSEATGLVASELHGCIMDNMTHLYHHLTVGSRFDDGMGLGDFVISDGDDNEDAQFSVAEGVFFDEDLEFELSTVGKLTGLQVWYRVAANWRWTINAGFSVVTTGSGRLGYDNGGVLTEVTNNNFVLCHIFASHIGTSGSFIAVVGQAQYTNKNDARDGAETEILSLAVPGTIVKEGVPIATIIFQTSNAYGNAVKARVVQTATGEDYIDWRTSTISSGTAAGDHGLLSGLGDKDHPAYLPLDGTSVMTGALDMGGQNIGNIGIITTPNEGLHILDTNASHDLIIKAGSDLSADRILSFVTGDAARTITLSGNPTLADWFDQAVKQASSPTFDDITISNPVNIYALSHDAFADWVANKHIDWTGAASNFLTSGTLGATGPWTLTQNSDTIVFSHTGTDAFVRWSDGVLNFQTSEVNAVTSIHLHPNGTSEESEVLFYDKDGVRLAVSVAADAAFIRSIAANLNLQGNQPYDILCWNSIASGNPNFYIYGWETGVGRRWGRMYIGTSGNLHIDSSQALIVLDDPISCVNITVASGGYVKSIVDNSAVTIYSSVTANKGAKIEFHSAGSGNSGNIYLDYGDFTAAIAAGATLNIRAMDNGGVITAIQCDKDGHTKVWDWDDSVLREVDFGADDSGGAGFKVLRIPN